MDLIAPDAVHDLAARVAAAERVVPVGGRTHWEVGGVPGPGSEVTAPAGVLAYDPAELTVTVGAGTSVADLDALLATAGQECGLDPRSANATVGGVLATGLSGPRRLRYGPVRDTVLEIRGVTADGRVVKGGGPTVKNVSGYDLPRLFVGSFGTLGVLVQATLRCRPKPPATRWFVADDPLAANPAAAPDAVRTRLFRPSSLLWDGRRTHVLLEGHPDDVEAEAVAAGLHAAEGPPAWPDGPCRGRISVDPSRLRDVVGALSTVDGPTFLAEIGVGTVHVATPDPDRLAAARVRAHAHGGWLLREAGAPALDGWGRSFPNTALQRRIRDAFDPTRKLAPGRVPG
ncbi:MAG: FAD-binding protein [Acidimicrobiia bacterium]